MRQRVLCALLLVATLAILMVPHSVFAQADAYHFTGVNFNFSNPGARARGIGGAFVALADDATASLANPAGLAYLGRQFTLEYIHDVEKAPVGQLTQGDLSLSGSIGSPVYTAVNDPYRVWVDSQSDRLNFASFVFPVAQKKVGLSVYYAALADLDQSYEVGVGLHCLDNGSPFAPNAGESCDDSTFESFYYPQSVTMRLSVDVIGAGFGWKLGDTFSIGASVGYVETSFNGRSLSDPSEWDATDPQALLTSQVDDRDIMYSLGVLYRGDRLGLGISYRSQTSFRIENTATSPSQVITERQFGGSFVIPERLAAGLAFFPGDNWVIAGEYVHLPYSVMERGMPTQFDQLRQQFGVEYAMDDVNEYHLGLEYTTFRANKGWSVRLGFWREQAHLIYSSQGFNDPVQGLDDRIQAGAALLYRELDLDFDHFTAGIGAAFGEFRVDAAVDYSSDAGTDFLLSAVIYF